ncbi:MAG TPA: hypothetical protein VFJ96_02460 [Gemmatimonadaceae bacterium]|nr:hypothetical protein [Gemmatimonadaceae bacterium]
MTNPLLEVDRGQRVMRIAFIVGIVGIVAWAIGLSTNPRMAFGGYLVAYATGVSLALGALLLVMIGHVTNATWFVVFRRITENAAATFPIFILLFVPLLLGLGALYPWAGSLSALPAELQTKILAKRAYLNVPFFIVRAFIYFVIWTGFSLWLRRASIRQDRDPSNGPWRLQRRIAAGGLPPVALALTFASFDWLMSLSPAWWSSIYGVYYFAGAMVGALGMVAVLAFACQRAGLLDYLAAPEHYGALGKLLLTFVIFWAYIAFAQYLIIWIADIPAEASWYLVRTRGGWAVLGIVVLVGQFAIPFLLLLFRALKRRPLVMAVLGVWLLVMHYLDIYWLVMPSLFPDSAVVSWTTIAAIFGVGGLAVAFGIWQLRGHAIVPRGDPELAASLEYGRTWAVEE